MARTLHLAATFLTAAVMVLCPLPFGSVDTQWVLVWCIPLAVSLPLFDLRKLTQPHLVRLAPYIGLAGLLLLVVWLQTRPGSAVLPANPLWGHASELLGQSLSATVSLYPAQSWTALANPVLMFSAFLCSFLAGLDRKGAKTVFGAAAYAGAVYAVYGILAQLLDPTSLLGQEKVAYVGDLTATFVNRNTAATFFGLALILWSARVLAEIDGRLPKSAARLRDFGSALLDRPSRELVVASAGAFFCFAALLMTRSRAGILLSLGSLAVTAVLLLRHRMTGRLVATALAGGLFLVVGLLLELLGGAVASRLGSQGLIDAGRLSAFSSSLSIIRDYPFLGTGLATFGDVYPAYRAADISTLAFWDRAHNTLLEIAVELGLPFAAAVLACWILGLIWLLRGGLARRRDSAFPLTAFGIGLLGSLHSLVDFSPQIPGFGVVWVALLGCGLAQSVRSEDGERRRAVQGGPVG